eukprot:CAMPEP_0177614676 /NCGR_PEP_ID=MMETSP0419_2-20121207/22879_1 /TAXON_ID=582737 /ORGANISM="Tetraselmis sp., Strain GSL018" /LENGTH=57 /DNA_ID=CAMNT_0019111943 /DNA_START=102 /DNA_END=275 /DNA_ORIENTATION=+
MTDQLQRLPGVAEMLSSSWVLNCPNHRDETSWVDIMSGPVGTWPCAATDLGNLFESL